MGFSVRIAPGVRVRASSRGMRASIGPRAARIHMGSGRTGISTGVGPFGAYTSLGGSRSRSSSSGRSSAYATPSPAAVQKAQEAAELAAIIEQILSVHHEQFHNFTRPIAQARAVPSVEQLLPSITEQHLQGISVFARKERKAARQAAEAHAQAQHAELARQAVQQQSAMQSEWDRFYQALTANDPGSVMGWVNSCFEDNEAPASVVDVQGTQMTVLLTAPAIDAIPERKPGTTSAGNLSIRKMTKTDRAALHSELICGHTLLTVKEAFAMAPGISTIRVVTFGSEGKDAYGQTRFTPLLAAQFSRPRMTGVQWTSTTAMRIVVDVSDALLMDIKRGQIQPIPLDDHPELKDLAQTIESD